MTYIDRLKWCDSVICINKLYTEKRLKNGLRTLSFPSCLAALGIRNRDDFKTVGYTLINTYLNFAWPVYSMRCLNDSKSLFLQEEDYVGEIKGGLRPTMRLIVMGIVHKQPKRFVSDTPVCVSRSFVRCHIAHPKWLASFRTRRAFGAAKQWASCVGDSTVFTSPVHTEPAENMGANREHTVFCCAL